TTRTSNASRRPLRRIACSSSKRRTVGNRYAGSWLSRFRTSPIPRSTRPRTSSDATAPPTHRRRKAFVVELVIGATSDAEALALVANELFEGFDAVGMAGPGPCVRGTTDAEHDAAQRAWVDEQTVGIGITACPVLRRVAFDTFAQLGQAIGFAVAHVQ